MCKNEKFDFVAMEHEILKLWEKEGYFQKLKEKNKGNEVFRFLDGPITANNPMGVHHAWGRTIKDIFIRYKAMNGYASHYRNGFDTQGLWVEVEVEKELGFHSKRDIEKYGLENFSRKCIERIMNFSQVITEQSKRLGQWMDWENSYYTHKDNNIAGIWYFLKKCHEKGWIVQYDKPMPWCPRCGTSLSAHEMAGSYKQLTHKSVFFRLPVTDRDYDMLVWTTTPWTLSSNVALAVNPEIDYCIVQLDGERRRVVLAKGALKVLKDENKKILKTIKGKELLDLEYETCFPSFPKQQSVNHRIVPWEDVDSSEGTGIVHIAPGCGEEDYELGKRMGLDQIQPVDELGIFIEGFDWLTGMKVNDAADIIFEELNSQGKLFKVEEYEHSYPVCWRCKTEVIFRLVKEWYIKSDEIRPQLIKAANQIDWMPAHMGKRMVDWLTNMGDWNISRKRFYGLPLPFYVCKDCGKLTVIGSKEELIEKGGEAAKNLPELHRPWIDEVKIICSECGNRVTRVPDIGDVWLDAGIVPYSTLGYFEDKAKWKRYFPAEWVTEMREQVRLWFYSMLFMSVVLEGKPPYEKVLSYNMVVSEDGSRFSKTGFMIKFDEASEKIGSEGIRYLFAGTNVTSDVRFGFSLGNEAKRKLLNLWNIFSFFDMYASIDKPDVSIETNQTASFDNLDIWLLTRTNDFIRQSTLAMEDYNTVVVVKEFEKFVDDISNWYIRVNRRKFWKATGDASKNNAYKCLYYALKSTIQIMAPIIPFLTEYLWQNCVKKMEQDVRESVHLSTWPTIKDEFNNQEVVDQVEQVRTIINLVLRLRNEKQIKVRQPLGEIYLLNNGKCKSTVENFQHIILGETNVKSLKMIDDVSEIEEEYLTLNFRKAGAALKTDLPKVKMLLENTNDELMATLVSQYYEGMVRLHGWEEPLSSELFSKQSRPRKNVITVAQDNYVIGLSTDISDELRIEGYMRDIVRNFQVFRKELGFDLEQRINIVVLSDDKEVVVAVNKYKEYIMQELLVDNLYTTPKNAMKGKTVVIGNKKVTIMIEKASS